MSLQGHCMRQRQGTALLMCTVVCGRKLHKKPWKGLGSAAPAPCKSGGKVWARHILIIPNCGFKDSLVTSQAWQRLPLPTQAGRVYFLRVSSLPFPSLPEGPRLAGTSGDHLVQCSSRETASELPRAMPRWILSISTTSADYPHSSEIIFFCLKRISRVSFGVHHLDTTPKTLAPFSLFSPFPLPWDFCKQAQETAPLLSPSEGRIHPSQDPGEVSASLPSSRDPKRALGRL